VSLWSAIRGWFTPKPDEFVHWGQTPGWLLIDEAPPQPSTAVKAAAILGTAGDTLRDRDAAYKGSDQLYASVMAAMFPDGVQLRNERDHHRFHLFMLAMVKVTRYARNWDQGHADSLIDLAAYAGMLAALDEGVPPVPGQVPI
jgi:hypothetical protein